MASKKRSAPKMNALAAAAVATESDDATRSGADSGSGSGSDTGSGSDSDTRPQARSEPARATSRRRRTSNHTGSGNDSDSGGRPSAKRTRHNSAASIDYSDGDAAPVVSTTDTAMRVEAQEHAQQQEEKQVEEAAAVADSKTQQREAWESLRRVITDSINRCSSNNIKEVIQELFSNGNLLSGRGLFARAILKAVQSTTQNTAPQLIPVYAAVLATLNTKIPQLGELCLKRTLQAFKLTYQNMQSRNGRSNRQQQQHQQQQAVTLSKLVRFMGHLVNQYVAHELLVALALAVVVHPPLAYKVGGRD